MHTTNEKRQCCLESNRTPLHSLTILHGIISVLVTTELVHTVTQYCASHHHHSQQVVTPEGLAERKE